MQLLRKTMHTDALLLPDLGTLPDDPTVLKQLVAQSLEALRKANGRLQRQGHYMHLPAEQGSMAAPVKMLTQEDCPPCSERRR
jgi:hypothetical protein